jgi:paraquat-inducible protein A
MTTARQAGLISCHFCQTLSKLPEGIKISDIDRLSLHCPCCQSTIHSRIPNSLTTTWALLIAAFILYIPANTLNTMTVIYLGDGQGDTILSGVMQLLSHGMWPLALLIFVASVFIPVLKLLTLLGLLLSIQFKAHWRPKDRTLLYRIIEFVGRWSMVDIFVIALLVTLVQFGNTASVTPNLGTLSFAAVVILTMFATHTFDQRLIWDAMENTDDETGQEQAQKLYPNNKLSDSTQ